jgi:flagellar motor protein MotB
MILTTSRLLRATRTQHGIGNRYALASGELKGGTFIVAGHTDAKGGDTYNQGLSERHADAVKRFLAEIRHRAGQSGHGRLRQKPPEERR